MRSGALLVLLARRTAAIASVAAAPARQPLLQLPDARTATGACSAAPADLIDGPSAIVDDRIKAVMGGGVAEANQHVVNLKLLFNIAFVKLLLRSASPSLGYEDGALGAHNSPHFAHLPGVRCIHW
jgi:hypothetical protein